MTVYFASPCIGGVTDRFTRARVEESTLLQVVWRCLVFGSVGGYGRHNGIPKTETKPNNNTSFVIRADEVELVP